MLVFHHNGLVDWNGEEETTGYQQTINIKLPGSKASLKVCLRKSSYAVPVVRDKVDQNIVPPRRIPLVKSCLQKAIRRGEVHAALGSCAFLLRYAPQDVLRRLPVIAVEDVAVADDLPRIVWLMAAHSHGYVLTEEDRLFVLSFAGSLARFPRRIIAEEGDTAWTVLELRDTNDIQFACVVRAAYGGMSCDVELLSSVAKTTCLETMPAIQVEPNDYLRELLNRLDLALEHRLLPAVDFHVSDILSAIPQISSEKAKNAMWTYWSGVNVRCNPPMLPPWWEELLPDLHRFASKEWNRQGVLRQENVKTKDKKDTLENQKQCIQRFLKRKKG